ncbi:unnamed protein product [Merluccius merluccius]
MSLSRDMHLRKRYPAVQESISLFMAYVHTSVNKASEKYQCNEKRHNYTTPKSFLQQITLYRKLLQESRAQLQYKMNNLECGLQKLQTTAMQVNLMELKIYPNPPAAVINVSAAVMVLAGSTWPRAQGLELEGSTGLHGQEVGLHRGRAPPGWIRGWRTWTRASSTSLLKGMSHTNQTIVLANQLVKGLKVSILLTDHLDPVHMLTSNAMVAAWHNQGLQGDRMSIENAAILITSERWPLVIDPQQQGFKWI